MYFESLITGTIAAVYAQVMRQCRAPHVKGTPQVKRNPLRSYEHAQCFEDFRSLYDSTHTQPELNLRWAGGTFQVSIPNFPSSAHW